MSHVLGYSGLNLEVLGDARASVDFVGLQSWAQSCGGFCSGRCNGHHARVCHFNSSGHFSWGCEVEVVVVTATRTHCQWPTAPNTDETQCKSCLNTVTHQSSGRTGFKPRQSGSWPLSLMSLIRSMWLLLHFYSVVAGKEGVDWCLHNHLITTLEGFWSDPQTL